MSVGGAAGTVAAGPLLTVASSRWLFGIPALVSMVATIPVAALLPPGDRRRGGGRIDWPGAVLLAGWLGLLLAISRPGSYGLLALPAAALAVLWLPTQRRARHPLVDLRTLALPTVRATNAATLLLGLGMFGSWMLVPLLVAQPASSGIGFGAAPTMVGLVMVGLAFAAVGALVVEAVPGRTDRRLRGAQHGDAHGRRQPGRHPRRCRAHLAGPARPAGLPARHGGVRGGPVRGVAVRGPRAPGGAHRANRPGLGLSNPPARCAVRPRRAPARLTDRPSLPVR
jgi:hypothetical protein